MKIIRDYVDAMFKDIPNTKKYVEIKMSMIDTMEEKYHDLVASGIDEQQAVATVISQFGNIDELKAEIGGIEESKLPILSTEQVTEYIQVSRKMGLTIAFGVATIICGVALSSIIESFNPDKYETLGAVAMLLVVALGVGILIINLLSLPKVDYIEKGNFRLSSSDYLNVKSQFDNFRPKFGLGIGFGVMLIISAMAMQVLLEEYLALHEELSGGLFLIMVAIAVASFVFYGVKWDMYDNLLNPEEKCEKDEGFGWLFGVTMPLTTVVFLLLGFLRDAWHIAWILFPIVAILTTVVVVILDRIMKK